MRAVDQAHGLLRLSAAVELIGRRARGSSPVRWPLLVPGLFGLAVFAALTVYATGHHYMPFDVDFERAVQRVRWGSMTNVFSGFDWLEGPRQDIAGAAVLILLIAFNWRSAPLVLTTAAGATAIYYVTELALKRPRPSAGLVNVVRHTGDYSFPSGHVVFFTWCVVLPVVCIVAGRVPRPVAALAWAIAALAILIACTGRIYLGEHWPSDVIAGLALGLGWTAVALSVRKLSNPVLARST